MITLFDECAFCVYITDNKGSDNDIWINKRFSTELGYDLSDVTGKDLIDLCVLKDDVGKVLDGEDYIRVIKKDKLVIFSKWEKHAIPGREIIFIHPYNIDKRLVYRYHNSIRNSLNGVIGFGNMILNGSDPIEYSEKILSCGFEISDALSDMEKKYSVAHKDTTDMDSAEAEFKKEHKFNKLFTMTEGSASSGDAMKVKLVYVEDNVVNVNYVKSMLYRYSDRIDFHYALTGSDGLKMIRDIRPKIILLDVMLPDMDGHEIYEILKKEGLLINNNVIFISSEYNKSENNDMLKPKTEYYFRKPISGYKFCKLINDTIDTIFDSYFE